MQSARTRQRDAAGQITHTYTHARLRARQKTPPTCSDLLLRRAFLQVAPPKTERSRSGLAVKISVLLHSGGEAVVERASVGVRERDGERRASESERVR